MKQTRTRAVATASTNVGSTRYRLYRDAYAHADRAIRAEFYLEAIAITESLLSDRLESRATFLLKGDFSFKTLEKLIQKLSEIEPDPTLRNLISQDVNGWKGSRNRALHEMAKLAHGESETWHERMAALPEVAKNGLAVVRKVDRRVKALRKTAR
ncbi:MAG: hypothetical protein Q8O42_21495 [Acidobacteriota bacterium]|nr:hypothetical protein [Acidobacteriota bacterium]